MCSTRKTSNVITLCVVPENFLRYNIMCSTSRKQILQHYAWCILMMLTGANSAAGTAYPSGAPEFTPGFSGVRVTRSLVLYVCFVDRCLSFCTFSFGHYVVCSSSIYGFWLPLDIRSILGPAKIHSVDLLDICWTCSYPLSCTLTLWQKICKSEQSFSLA